MMGVLLGLPHGRGALGAQLSPLALQWGLAGIAPWRCGRCRCWRRWRWLWWQLGRMATPAAGATQRGASAAAAARAPGMMLAFGLMNGGYASMIAWLAPTTRSWLKAPRRAAMPVALLSIAQAAAAPAAGAGCAKVAARPPALAMVHPAARRWALRCWPWHLFAAPLATAIVRARAAASTFMLVALDYFARAAAGRRVERAHARAAAFCSRPCRLADSAAAPGRRRFSGGWWLRCAMGAGGRWWRAWHQRSTERVMQPPVP